jgi:hypothetical protein
MKGKMPSASTNMCTSTTTAFANAVQYEWDGAPFHDAEGRLVVVFVIVDVILDADGFNSFRTT